MIWLFLSDRLSYVMENIPTCITYTLSKGYHFKKEKTKQALYDASNCNPPCGDNNDKYYCIQHGLKKDVLTLCSYQPLICGTRMMQNLNQPKHGLMWACSNFMVEQLQM